MMSRKRSLENTTSNDSPKKQQKLCDSEEINENDEWDHWYEWDYDKWLQFYDDTQGIDSSIFNRQNYIHKLARNRTVGDYCIPLDLQFDVYVSKKLKVDELKLNNLKNELFSLGYNNNDWLSDASTFNFIDPDLYFYKHAEKTRWSNEFKANFDQDIDEILTAVEPYVDPPTQEGEWNALIEHEKRGYFIRNQYQWLATEFNENKQYNKIEMTSSIHNISPRHKYENIYNGIEYIFEQMLPLFNKFDAFKNRNNNSFQCIVKCQRYCINDQWAYKEIWHKEGLSENIIIVGLYYFEKNEKLEGGDLKFRNVESYNDNQQNDLKFQDMPDYDIDASNYIISPTAKINDGTAIVFDNRNLVRRQKLLKNKIGDNKKRYQSFLTFSIIDPNKRTNISTKYYSTLRREEYIPIIIEYGNKKCPFDIAKIICEFAECGFTFEEAKNIRQKVIEMTTNTKTKGRWGSSDKWKNWYKHGKANQYEYSGWCPDYWESLSDSEF